MSANRVCQTLLSDNLAYGRFTSDNTCSMSSTPFFWISEVM